MAIAHIRRVAAIFGETLGRDSPGVHRRAYFEFSRPELLALIPGWARRVLDVGCGAGMLGASLKARQEAVVYGIELDAEAAAAAKTRLDHVLIGDAEQLDPVVPGGPLDCIVCGDILEHLREPEAFLRRALGWLVPGGILVASIPNVRHLSVLEALLEGDWTYEPAGLLDRDHLRFFTRRDIERLFSEAGFALVGLDRVPGPGHAAWSARGRPGNVDGTRLRLRGLPAQEAEEFFIYQYLVRAVPDPPRIPTGPQPPRGEARPRPADYRPLLEWIPPSARRILHIGCGPAEMTEAIRQRTDAEINGITQGPARAAAAEKQLHRVTAADVEPLWPGLAPGSFDCVLCDILAQVKDPWRLLRQVRDWLAPGGRLLVQVPNLRDHRAIAALVGGTTSEPGVPALEGANLRFFTRREIEKALFRSGFEPVRARAVPGPGHAQWVAQGRPGVIRLGRFALRGLSPGEAEEFYASHWVLEARLRPSYPGPTSIIILTHNQLDCTRQCVESIGRYTDEPYELVFVDNGSSDGTVEYLRGIPGAKLIANRHNLGFPAGVNQGIRAASGPQVLMLNNDCIVTTGWLDRLLRALYSEPDVGLVGPCSNCVSGPQQVAAGYEDLARLDSFAWDFCRAADRCYEPAERLVGFCLLVKREVIDRIGLLDERFGLGCYEDDDFCRRALKAGYRLLIVRDSFVHHFGGRTFLGSGLDLGKVLEDAQRRFRQKWAEDDLRHPLAAGPGS
ncbi:MAG: methyltransferase domain-containing protein [Thermoguttaceae bacterium]